MATAHSEEFKRDAVRIALTSGLTRQNGIFVIRTRKYKVTTDSSHKFNIASNSLDQDISAKRPNQKWVLDISLNRPGFTGG